MAGEYMVQEESKPVSRRFEKILRIFIIMAALVLAAELIWLLGVSPFRPLARIDISGLDLIGSAEIGRDEIIAMAGISPDSSFISVSAKEMESSLLRYSFLESVRVYKRFPDRVEIILEARRAVAVLMMQINGFTVPALIDSSGVIFEIGSDRTSANFSLPVISGLIIEDPFPGMELHAVLVPLFREIEKISIGAPELLDVVSEIRINRRTANTYDLEIFPIHHRVRVRLSELNEDILRYTLLMIDVLARDIHGFGEGGITSLDFRSGIASYIPREAFSE